jgi:26S proteasome regulatory subunit N10
LNSIGQIDISKQFL